MKRPPSDEARQIARSAAHFLTLLESGDASTVDRAELQRWRELDSRHEQAWQKVQALRGRFGGLPPELAMASLDRPQAERRRLLKGMLGLAVVAPAGWLVSRELPIDAWRADLSTATGERRSITLADGGRLDLNTATAVNLDEARRHLKLLRGEIALQSASPRPFTIETAEGRAVLGQGWLCVRERGDACEFSVFEGVAELQVAGGQPVQLLAGQRAMLRRGTLVPAQAFDPHVPGWREGVLMANDQPLGDFLRELDRYRPGILRWAPALEALRVTGSFRLDDTDQALALLAASLPLEVHSRTRYWVTLVPREKHA